MDILQTLILRRLGLILFCGIILMGFSACTIVTEAGPEQFPTVDRADIHTYFMKQKIWTIGNKFLVKTDYGKPVFYIKSKFFSIGNKLKLFDMDGEELLYIKQKIFSFRNKYKIYRNRQLYAKMVKKLILFKNRYVLDIKGPDDYHIEGDFFNYHYRIFFRGRKVATISKKWPAWGDKYRISIVRGHDEPLIIAAAVVIDMINHDGNNDDIFDD